MAKKKETEKPKDQKKPKVAKELEGFDVTINNFGEIKTTYNLDKLNEFLNENVDDKKLRNREDLPVKKNKKTNK